MLFPAIGDAVLLVEIPHFHKQAAAYYWLFVQEHIGLYAPRMPNDRPQNAEALAKKRPFLAEDYSACGIILVIPTPELFRADSTSCTDCPKNAVHTKSTGGIIRPPIAFQRHWQPIRLAGASRNNFLARSA